MKLSTADLCDQNPQARACVAPWQSYGGRSAFGGRVVTVRAFEDAGLIRQKLEMPGHGCVLVVDAGGSLQRAVLGDRMAASGARNGWAGVLVHGAVRDTVALAAMDFGVVALGRVPARGTGHGTGECDVALRIAGVDIHPGQLLALDADGVVVMPDTP
ncbi:ribonuclease E activity regulator RraA [Comamonas endophytica]|uniref:4-hydroxy-4-methyl-2-oxoglutarate aldolase n=1 Tax=Comamonas endophytica TaxID=2949090 RepID=A0ABY6GFT4_9BURK|nr:MULTISPECIES: ribonuclease E activity regulator RraA [unclassified Acidovorax]MCD2512460.1 ribonuclease E activity regulator RraA [Acidovorax sp. D4N7]UYG53170.1 ribonuclease E activity regulator RraA [Acidovorax sp. 5MLIR]